MGNLVPGREYPCPGVPPWPGQDWGISPGQDWVPPRLGWGTAPARTRFPPPPRQNCRATTCYAAGGMPLAFTQEDCLVVVCCYEMKLTWKWTHIAHGPLTSNWKYKVHGSLATSCRRAMQLRFYLKCNCWVLSARNVTVHVFVKSPSKFNVVSVVWDTFTRKMGYTPILPFRVSICEDQRCRL